MAKSCGLALAATVRRVVALTNRILREVPGAVEAVRAMPAGPGVHLNRLARDILARAVLVDRNAQRDDEPEEDSGPVNRAEAFPSSL